MKTTRAAGSSRTLRLGCGVAAQLQRAGGSVKATVTAAVLTNTTPPRRTGGTGTPRCGEGGTAPVFAQQGVRVEVLCVPRVP